MRVTGNIKTILDKVSGDKRDGSGTWEKQSFIVETNENYNNTYFFELFGADRVSVLNSKFAVGSPITVDFNISTNEYKGKYYTSLQAWKLTEADLTDQDLVG